MENLIKDLDNNLFENIENLDKEALIERLKNIPIVRYWMIPDHLAARDKSSLIAIDYQDDDTSYGAILLWEFASHVAENSFEGADLNIAATRVRRFCDLLVALNISTRYDCGEGYGSQVDEAHTAFISHLMFEMDDDNFIDKVRQVAILSGIFLDKDEFDDFYGVGEYSDIDDELSIN